MRVILAIALLASAFAATTANADSTATAMYFHSQVRDAPECGATANDTGDISYPASIKSPAATCPDAFGWAQFLEAIQAEFWKNWANDETIWVSDPKPVCATDSATDCCFWKRSGTPLVGYRDAAGKVQRPDDIGAPGKYCPYQPGDWGGADEITFSGGKPGSSHNTTFLRELDPARIARQGQVEVVYRNQPFTAYTTALELYSKPGLAKLFGRISGEAANSLPYRPNGQGVSYPAASVMFKVGWVSREAMLELGYVNDHDNDPATPPQDAANPYITMKINASSDDGKTYKEDIYYLASITGSSKALPNWHWYAFEHVNNVGRCDFTGCNDSFGFTTTISIKAPLQENPKTPVMTSFESNFITPHTRDDQLKDNDALFELGKRYPSGNMTDDLTALFKGTGVATGAGTTNPERPQVSDPAWKSYRLKGTQTQFYNRDGYPTILGASITEGGFVNTASCMSCHVQASVNASGGNGVPGVGATGRLNILGLGTVVSGAPENADFFDRGTTNQRAVQTDFVWGILFAQDAEKAEAPK